jgi:outer membrane receptor for ferrienterochelin and colicin
MKRIGMVLLSAGIGLMMAATCPADTQTGPNDPQQAQKEAVHLEEMVVTATKTEKEIKDTPASISVIKANELDSSPNMTLDEAFRYTPSVQIIRGEGVATVHNFTNIRGIGDSRNLLYVDGVNMVESMSGNTNLSFLPTAGVDRIEILRGPSSALYGGRGMSGVINIMTKTPEPGWHGSIKPALGNYDYQKYLGAVSYGSEPFSVSLDLSEIKTNNYWSRDTIIRRDYDYRTGTYSYDYDSDYEKEGHEGWENWNRDYEEKALKSKIQFRPSDILNLTVVGGIMNNETGNSYTDRYTDSAGNDVEKNLEKKKDYIGLMGDANFAGKSTLAFRLTYHNPEYTNLGENMDLSLSLDDPAQLSAGGRAPQFYRSKSIQGSKDYEAELKWSVPVSHQGIGEHLVTIGAEYLRNDIYWSIDEEDTGRALTPEVDLTKDAWSLYLQDEYFINAKWTLTAGLRGDFYEDFDDQVSPKISLLYKHNPSTQYFLSGGYAYNPPAYSDKFGTDWNMTSYTIRTNNPDLDAEKLKSVEAGVRKSIAEKFNGSLSAYYTEADDLIESIKERRLIGGAGSHVYMTYEYHANIDRATMKGIESEFNFDVTANHRISGNLTYMEAKNEETGQRLERSPNWLGSIAYTYNRPFNRYRFWTTLRGRGQDGIYIGEYSVDEPREVSGFFVVDVSLGFDIGKYFSLFGDVTNLFDKDYREFTYTRYQPGRMGIIGCEIKI